MRAVPIIINLVILLHRHFGMGQLYTQILRAIRVTIYQIDLATTQGLLPLLLQRVLRQPFPHTLRRVFRRVLNQRRLLPRHVRRQPLPRLPQRVFLIPVKVLRSVATPAAILVEVLQTVATC